MFIHSRKALRTTSPCWSACPGRIGRGANLSQQTCQHDRGVSAWRRLGCAGPRGRQRHGRGVGQPVIVENVVGVGGALGVLKVANAQLDGHTLWRARR